MTQVAPPDIPSAVGQQVLHDYFRRLNAWSFDGLKSKLPRDEAVSQILLQSPGGKVYSITISDAGALTATLVAMGSHV